MSNRIDQTGYTPFSPRKKSASRAGIFSNGIFRQSHRHTWKVHPLRSFLLTLFLLGTILPQSLQARNSSTPGNEFARGERPFSDVRGDSTINSWTRYGEVTLALDQIQYGAGEDIPVRFRVTNRGYTILRIFPSLNPSDTFQFQVLNEQGRELSLSFNQEQFDRRESGDRQVVNLAGDPVKEILLHPGETFEKRIFLNDFYNLEPGQSYRITGYFYPDYREPNLFQRTANVSRIRIVRRSFEEQQRRYHETRRLNEGTPGVTPEETIYLFLSAEMLGNRQNYLKYLDLRKFITAYDRFASKFVLAPADEKSLVLNEFADFLTQKSSDRLKRFKILRSERERNREGVLMHNGRAFVDARAIRDSGGYRVTYEYRYTLEIAVETSGEFWKIVHVAARIVK